MMTYSCLYGGLGMRTTLALDDDLLDRAQTLTGLEEKSSLVREALKALIERESARRLARLGGSEPHLKAAAPAAAKRGVILVDTPSGSTICGRPTRRSPHYSMRGWFWHTLLSS